MSAMRMCLSLLASWVAGTLVFSLPWLRFSDWERSSYVVRTWLFDFGIICGVLVLVIGVPVAYLATKWTPRRWWLVVCISGVIGAGFGYLSSWGGSVEASSYSFAPWLRPNPGYIRDYGNPYSLADLWGSVMFGAIVGASMGTTFRYFYTVLLRPNPSLERP
jgi:hypothetical protein